MDLTLRLDEDTDPQIVNQILNLAREADADLYEAAKRGWVFYGLAAAQPENMDEEPIPTWAVHKLLVQTEGAPFSDAQNTSERADVRETLERLELDGLIDRKREDGEWQGWEIVQRNVKPPLSGVGESTENQGVRDSSPH